MAKDQQKKQNTGEKYILDIVGVSKSFLKKGRQHGYTTLKSFFLQCFGKGDRRPADTTNAIQNLTLRVLKGASVGIIGRNGSGKSTLLKLITGIYRPDKGSIAVHGRIAALIELGAGFHPDFSGRENLFLGGVMHGMSRAEIEDRFDDIVQFAELEDFIDEPVRTYSSGMFMRLGFSLAIHTDPDLLLIDEVLSVGDAAFVRKCKDRIAKLRTAGKTLFIVSHDLDAVERWCDEVLWIDSGEVQDRGDPRRVIDHYREFLERDEEAKRLSEVVEKPENEAGISETTDSVAEEEPKRWGSREVEIVGARLLDAEGAERRVFSSGEDFLVEINYLVHEDPGEDRVFGVALRRGDGLMIHGTNTDIENVSVPVEQSGSVRYRFVAPALLDGSYELDVAVHRKDGYPFDYHHGAITFAVRDALKQVGVFTPDHQWEFTTEPKQEAATQ